MTAPGNRSPRLAHRRAGSNAKSWNLFSTLHPFIIECGQARDAECAMQRPQLSAMQ